jgi:hypothetical protein
VRGLLDHLGIDGATEEHPLRQQDSLDFFELHGY